MTHQKKHEEKPEETEQEMKQEETSVPEKTDTELAQEYLNDLKRLQAEFENYKRRQAEGQKELRGMLIEKLVLDIIPVMDNFRAATEHVPEEQKSSPWVVGIQYIEKQLEKVLSENGVTTIEVKPGDTFDPTIHEAVSSEESEGEQHVVVKIIQNGYKIGERVVRPAKVTVK